MSNILIKAIGLKKYYPIYSRILRKVKTWLKAVDDVTLYIHKGESLGIVGESGSGKTTLGMVLAKLIEPTAGRIFFRDIDISSSIPKDLRRKIRVVFQDPYAALNPRIKIIDQVVEPLIANGIEKHIAIEKGFKVLDLVGLSQEIASKYPHELSGGQRQRVVIARALITDPEFLILDEPTSMLDVSTQAQILNLLKILRARYSLTYLFITHNLAVARYICDRIAVMYAGKIVELADKSEIFRKPLHPYTKALISAYPPPDPDMVWEPEIPEELMIDLANPPTGCRFHPRCPFAMDMCSRKEPPIIDTGNNHYVSCWLYHKI